MTRSLLTALALAGLFLSFASPALARDASPQVGEEAPELGNLTWAYNPPETSSIADLRGEVIIVEKWGINCGPCIRYMPTLSQKMRDHGPRGLHIFAIESQGHNVQQIRERLDALNIDINFSVSTPGAHSYQTGGGIPYAWLIGVDGTVLFAGRPTDQRMTTLMQQELDKIRYPGLGRLEVHEDVARAATFFSAERFDRARNEAQEILDRADRYEDEPQALEDAQFVLDRVQEVADSKLAEAETAEEARDYVRAMEIYQYLERTFGRDEIAEQAEDRLREMRRDDDIQNEIEAQQRLDAIVDQFLSPRRGTRPNIQTGIRILENFIEDYEGTAAAAQAADHLARLEEMIPRR